MKKLTLPLFFLCGVFNYAQEKEIKEVTIPKILPNQLKELMINYIRVQKLQKRGFNLLEQ